MNESENIGNEVLLKKIEEMIDGLKNDISFGQKQIFSVDEAARYIGVSKQQLYILSSNKVLTYYKSKGGGRNFYKKEDLDDYMVGGEIVKSLDLIEETAKSIISAIEKKKRIYNKTA